MSSALTLEQYLLIDTNFDPPEFSLDYTFKLMKLLCTVALFYIN
jgi:hypothetical protein